MPSLLEKLAAGAGQGIAIVGRMGLEEARERRLAKMREEFASKAREEERAFRTSEREATQEFRAGEREADKAFRTGEREATQEFRTGEREASQKYKTSEREAGQEFQMSIAEKRAAAAGEKPDKVKFRDTDEFTGKTVITYESGKREEYDPETDTTRELGKGEGTVSEDAKGEDKAWGERMANRQAKLLSGDESDFPFFKSEERAAEAAAQFRSNARTEGKLEEFDTEFAKRGWSYIQELAGGDSPTSTGSESQPTLMGIFKDFERSQYDGIANQIINDP